MTVNDATRRGTLFVISAPSGGGKTTLSRRLLAATEGMNFSVSYTTRQPREGEVNGQDYHFVDPDTFARMANEGAFLEHAEVFGHRYGTGRGATEQVLDGGTDLLLDIDIQGGRQIRASGIDHVLVFIMPPSAQILEERLRSRRRDSDEEVGRRLALAGEEALSYDDYDYLVINDDLDRAAETLISIVRAERHRVSRCRRRAERVLATFDGDR